MKTELGAIEKLAEVLEDDPEFQQFIKDEPEWLASILRLVLRRCAADLDKDSGSDV